MKTTFNVRFWEIQHKENRRRPYGVQWITETREHGEWFKTKALANGRRSELMQATRRGEAFDIESGRPGRRSTRRSRGCSMRINNLQVEHRKGPREHTPEDLRLTRDRPVDAGKPGPSATDSDRYKDQALTALMQVRA